MHVYFSLLRGDFMLSYLFVFEIFINPVLFVFWYILLKCSRCWQGQKGLIRPVWQQFSHGFFTGMSCLQKNKSAKEHSLAEWRVVFQPQSFMGCAGVGEYGVLVVYIQDFLCLSLSLSLRMSKFDDVKDVNKFELDTCFESCAQCIMLLDDMPCVYVVSHSWN